MTDSKSSTTHSPFVELTSSANPYHSEADIENGHKSKSNSKDCECVLFLDSIGVQFHLKNFLYQSVAHFIFPLFPFMVNLHGQAPGLLYSWVTPVLVHIMIVSFVLSYKQNEDGMRGVFLIPLIYYLQHRLVIAIKYGTMSKTEYKKFMDCKDSKLCEEYMAQIQLNSGWFNYNRKVIHFELAAASARIGARINDIDIEIANPKSSASAMNQLRAWNAFLRGHDVIDYSSPPCQQLRPQPDGTYALSVYDLCEGLLMKSTKFNSDQSMIANKEILAFNIINLLIPLVLIGYYYNPDVTPATLTWMVLFYISSTITNYVYARTFYVLLYVAITDCFRQLSIVRDLNCMIRMTDIMLWAELSATKHDVTADDFKKAQERVAEILTIRPANCSVKFDSSITTNQFENPDSDDLVTHKPLHSSCILGERIYKDNEYHQLPRISFDESHNIVAWTHARLVMQNFGERFKFRLELYVICAITMLVVLMVMGLMQLGISQHRLQMVISPWFLQALLSVTMCIGFLIIICQTGAKVNETLEMHSQTMGAHALRLHRKIEFLQSRLCIETSPVAQEELVDRIEKLSSASEKLDAMRAVVDTNTELKPYKVFGLNAQSSLTTSVLTTACSFYVILISLISHSEGQALSAVTAV